MKWWPFRRRKQLGQYLQEQGVPAGHIQAAVLRQNIDRGRVPYEKVRESIVPDLVQQQLYVAEAARETARRASEQTETIRARLKRREPVTQVATIAEIFGEDVDLGD